MVKRVNFDTHRLFDYRGRTMQLVLASQSRYRKALLESAGFTFVAESPRVDEEDLKNYGPRMLTALTQFLALKKAESLKSEYQNAIIIGCDQIAELNGERLDKPGSVENAVIQLKKLQGRSHRLITSVAILSPLKIVQQTETTILHMRSLSDAEIRAYVALDQPVDCAGAYKIEKAGLTLMEKVETSDPSAIQGLPMIALTHALFELGINLTDLWRRP